MLDHLLPHYSGELYFKNTVPDRAMRSVYSTDASVYQEHPLAVVVPKTIEDIVSIVKFANETGNTIIPRAAGTSLAGQVVGSGIVVDISRYFTKILEVNQNEKWVRVQPGVIRDDLNAYLKPFGLMFGPETSTSNRAMIGGMIGNNSSGLHSIIWGDTRSNILEIEAILYNGEKVKFAAVDKKALSQLMENDSAEGKIHKEVIRLLQEPEHQKAIIEGFPKKSISRRNTGYALDKALEMLEDINNSDFNLCKLLAGSEGTLCFVTEAKLNLIDLPLKEAGMVAIHTGSVHEALLANLVA
nr:FAD-binding oxidoreductase [Bacteroidota bacterium]